MGKQKKQGKDMYNKVTKTNILLGSELLKSYIPTTKIMNRHTLKTMLEKEKMVYIKPRKGSLGYGVMKLEVDRNDVYHCQSGFYKSKFTSFDRLYRYIQQKIGSKPYLVQKGIRLLTYKGAIFDIRVMVQHNAKRKWEVTGMAGRVARSGKVVTNGSQGGAIYAIDTLLKPYADAEKRKALLATIKRISLQAARTLCRNSPNHHVVGTDIGIDRRLKPWIIEVNWTPDPCPFTKLTDRTMLRRILRYAKYFGHTYKLNCIRARKGR